MGNTKLNDIHTKTGIEKTKIPVLNEYVSFAFEDVCKEYLRRMNKQNKLPFRFLKVGRWWNKKDEIDIVAFDNIGNVLFGECKWKSSKVGIKELNRLKEKALSVEGSFANKYYYIFSKSGFEEELLDMAKIDNSLKLIDLKNIFE